jgi:cytochrome c oxidase assembly protein subunit 11
MKTDPNKRLAVKLALVAVLMFGFGYIMVPIYDVFCKVTGINGKTGRISEADAEREKEAADRLVTVEFDTNVNNKLPWKFKPLQLRLKVHPGAINEAMFYAENLSNDTIVGQAVPSVAPNEASLYFNKTECFCFTQQTLEPKQHRTMPVRFIIDPDLPRGIRTVTLSYTFFRAPGSYSEATAGSSAAPETANKIL